MEKVHCMSLSKGAADLELATFPQAGSETKVCVPLLLLSREQGTRKQERAT